MQALRLNVTQQPAASRDIPTPGLGEALMKLHAALSHLVSFGQKGQYMGIRLPRILEANGIGEVAAQGANVPAGEYTVDLKVETLPPGGYHYALEFGGKPVAHHNLLVQ